MKELQQILTTFDDWLWGNWLLFVLLGVGLLYTIITGGIQIRRFGYIIRKTIWEPILSKSKESKEAGTISSSRPCVRQWHLVREAAILWACPQPCWQAAWEHSGCGCLVGMATNTARSYWVCCTVKRMKRKLRGRSMYYIKGTACPGWLCCAPFSW